MASDLGKNLLLLFMSCFVVFILLEILAFGLIQFVPNNSVTLLDYKVGVRCSGNYKEWDPYMIMRYRKNYDESTGCTINNRGYLGDDFSTHSDAYRIFMIGGSTVWGVGSTSLDYTIPAQLQSKLRAQGHNVEVINAGAEGYASTQEMLKYIREIHQYDPDMIIVFDGRNDMFYSHKNFWSTEVNHETIPNVEPLVQFVPNTKTVRYLFGKGVGLVISKTQMFKLVKRLAPERSIYEPQGVFNPVSAEEYYHNLDTLVTLARADGVDVAVFLQPTLGYGKNTLSQFESDKIAAIERTSNWIDIMTRLMPLYENKVHMLGEKHDITTVSLIDVFENTSENIYTDSVHYNDVGHGIIADQMVPVVTAHID